jgi:hypothetical protein
VTKIVVPLAGPAFTADDNVVAGDFSMNVKDGSAVDVAGSPHAGSAAGFTFTNIAPGSYTVGESGPITFPGEHVVATYSGDCNGVNTVTIAAGQTKSCTVTNTYTADQS